MEIRDAYERWAATYDGDRNLTRDLDAVVTAEALGGRRWGTVLELGCGTGKNTAFLAEWAERVVALDFSAAMMARARERVTSGNVHFTYADLTRAWPIATGTIDLVVANLVLEHVPDLSYIYSEATRCLGAGGTVFNSELHPYLQYQGKKAIYEYEGEMREIGAFIHHLSDFVRAATANGLSLVGFDEKWHALDDDRPPRLATFLFVKTAGRVMVLDG